MFILFFKKKSFIIKNVDSHKMEKYEKCNHDITLVKVIEI